MLKGFLSLPGKLLFSSQPSPADDGDDHNKMRGTPGSSRVQAIHPDRMSPSMSSKSADVAERHGGAEVETTVKKRPKKRKKDRRSQATVVDEGEGGDGLPVTDSINKPEVAGKSQSSHKRKRDAAEEEEEADDEHILPEEPIATRKGKSKSAKRTRARCSEAEVLDAPMGTSDAQNVIEMPDQQTSTVKSKFKKRRAPPEAKASNGSLDGDGPVLPEESPLVNGNDPTSVLDLTSSSVKKRKSKRDTASEIPGSIQHGASRSTEGTVTSRQRTRESVDDALKLSQMAADMFEREADKDDTNSSPRPTLIIPRGRPSSFIPVNHRPMPVKSDNDPDAFVESEVDPVHQAGAEPEQQSSRRKKKKKKKTEKLKSVNKSGIECGQQMETEREIEASASETKKRAFKEAVASNAGADPETGLEAEGQTPKAKNRTAKKYSASTKQAEQDLEESTNGQGARDKSKRKRTSKDVPKSDPQINAVAGPEMPASQRKKRRVRVPGDFEETSTVPSRNPKPKPANHRITKEEANAIYEAVEQYREMEDVSQYDLNARIQGPADAETKAMWDHISEEFPNFTRTKIMHTVRRKFHNFEARGTWTAEQDEDLTAAYKMHGNKWKDIGIALNRFAEDCRDRWRNYLVCGDKLKKDLWTMDEEDALRDAVRECIAHIHEGHGTGQLISEAEAESLIDWQVVSVKMGRTRSRLQCANKWKKIKERQLLNNAEPAHQVGGTEWRVTEAARFQRVMTPAEKLKLLYAMRDSGAAAEYKVPWTLIQKEKFEKRGIKMALRLCFQDLSARVPAGTGPALQDVVSFLIDAFEASSPHVPEGYEEKYSPPPPKRKYEIAYTPSKKSKRKRDSTNDESVNGLVSSSVSRKKRQLSQKMRKEGEGDSQETSGGEPDPADGDMSDLIFSLKSSTPKTPRVKAKKPIVSARKGTTQSVLSKERISESEDEQEAARVEDPKEVDAEGDVPFLSEEESAFGDDGAFSMSAEVEVAHSEEDALDDTHHEIESVELNGERATTGNDYDDSSDDGSINGDHTTESVELDSSTPSRNRRPVYFSDQAREDEDEDEEIGDDDHERSVGKNYAASVTSRQSSEMNDDVISTESEDRGTPIRFNAPRVSPPPRSTELDGSERKKRENSKKRLSVREKYINVMSEEESEVSSDDDSDSSIRAVATKVYY